MFDNICKINSKIEVTGIKEKSLIMIVKNNEVKTKEKYYLLVCRDANQKNKCCIFSNTSNESIKYLWNGENFNAFGGLLRVCRELKHVDISKLNTKNAKTLSYTFGYSKIKGMDMPKINTENIEDLSKIFCGCKELEKVILPKYNLY